MTYRKPPPRMAYSARKIQNPHPYIEPAFMSPHHRAFVPAHHNGFRYQKVHFQPQRRLFAPKAHPPVPQKRAGPMKRRSSIDMYEDDVFNRRINSLRAALFSVAQEELDTFMFMRYAPRKNYYKDVPMLPRKSRNDFRPTLSLDLDETLIHSSSRPMRNYDHVVRVGRNHKIWLRKRPFLREFLEAVSKRFEVILFTASQQTYADSILDVIDPHGKYFEHRLYRESCIEVQGTYVKDLRVLRRDMAKVIHVDNSPAVFTYQINNGVPIPNWYDDRSDPALIWMVPIMQRLYREKDVRPLIRKWFEMEQLLLNLRSIVQR